MSSPTADAPRDRQLVLVLPGLMITLFLAALDGTIVSTAMPRIVADLHGFERYSWVATAYLLTSTVLIPLWAKLSDLIGRKPVLLSVVVGFVLGSALCGAAQEMDQLILFRAVQGVFGGGVLALVFSAIADIFSPAERGKWMGLFFAMFGLASVVGPLAGGVITETTSWRWVFYVNLPVGLAALLLLAFGFPFLRPERSLNWRALDVAGAAVLTLATTALLFGLVQAGTTRAWLAPTTGALFALAAGGGMLFIVIERRALEPIIPLELFRSRAVASGAALCFCCGFLMLAAILYAPLYAQAVLGDTPTQAGGVLIAFMLTMMVGNTVVGRLLAHFKRIKPIMLAGVALPAVGLGTLLLLGGPNDRMVLIGGLIVYGAGLSFLLPPANIGIQNAVEFRQLGAATGLSNFARSIGQTVGAAVVGSIVVGRYAASLPALLPPSAQPLDAGTLAALTNPQRILGGEASRLVPPAADPTVAAEVAAAAQRALAVGIHDGFLAALVVALAASAIVVFWVPDQRLREAALRPAPPRPPLAQPSRL
ncbi:MAG: MDR family MFS transporter [Chloroflexota bacterium]|nr:MFS transporter [Dehalococcoidia bacterium]MDW8255187.1 MDR family MFS transporter [Chloroflexota bacterium]